MTGPRFTVEPTGIVSGRWRVLDGKTGMLARDAYGRPAAALTRAAADRLARQRNANAVCVGCRHRRPVADMIDRRCPACRGDGRLL